MAACGGAHYWARRFREHGHEVKRMAPQFVKPYVTCIPHIVVRVCVATIVKTYHLATLAL